MHGQSFINEFKMIIFVIGVSGCGKSTIASKLSSAIGIPYYDADDYHSKSNIEKMRMGRPLNDNDRSSWLSNLSTKLQEWEKEEGAILACSALKEKYRETLLQSLEKYRWVFLSGSYDLIFERMHKREGHFMTKEMLKSQFDALEVPTYGLHIDIENSPEEIVEKIKSVL